MQRNKPDYILVGMPDAAPLAWATVHRNLLLSHHWFAGGTRHYELVKHLLPPTHHWIEIRMPLKDFLKQLSKVDGTVVIFASGDPLFFGIGNTIQRAFPEATIENHPAPGSLQLLAMQLRQNFGLFRCVSLTGRPWKELDRCLLMGERRLAILTDRKKTPAIIAQRLLEYGYGHYHMTVGERMGGTAEKITEGTLDEIKDKSFDHPNCLLLQAGEESGFGPHKGLDESEFIHLEGRPNMITKLPVRLTVLAAMQLSRRRVFWDVGSCTGSMAIEAQLQAPHLLVKAFEKRVNSKQLITANARRFGAPGIQIVEGDFLSSGGLQTDRPDAVFLGGYGGKMTALLDVIHNQLKVGGVLAFNAVSNQSKERFCQWLAQHQYPITTSYQVQLAPHQPINIILAQKPKEK